MEAVLSMIAGMVLVGAFAYRAWSFDPRYYCRAFLVTAFLMCSIAVGLLLSNPHDVQSFQIALGEKLPWLNPDQSIIGYSIAAGIIVHTLFVILVIGDGSCNKDQDVPAVWFLGIIIGSVIGLTVAFIIHKTASFSYAFTVQFIILMLALGIVNALAGVVFIALNASLALIAYSQGQAIKFFSLLGLLDVVQLDNVFVAFAFIVITTALGSLELVLQQFHDYFR